MNIDVMAPVLISLAAVVFVVWLARLERRPFGRKVFLKNRSTGSVGISWEEQLSESQPCLANFAIEALLPSAQFVQSEQEADTCLFVVWMKKQIGIYGRDARYGSFRIDCSVSVRDRRSRLKPRVSKLFLGSSPPKEIAKYGDQSFSATGHAPVEQVSNFIRTINIEAPH